MRPARLLIIGGSAGSLQVILAIVSALRPGISLPVLIVLHRNNIFESSLEDLFAARTKIPIKEIEEKEPVLPGIIYLSPADYHVLLEKDGTFSLDYSERVHFSRPSIDVTLLSAAEVYGSGLTALLLSGGNADGADGMAFVKEKGGTTVVQDPDTADVPYMPQQAITRAKTDFILPADELPRFIRELANLPR